jgi:hypothetical protein
MTDRRATLLPADRLGSIAARILAAQPDPPRRVGLVEVLAAYEFLGLVLISDAVILIALLVFGGPIVRPYVLALAAIMILGSLTLAGPVVSSGRGSLQNGIVAEGEVVAVQRRGWPAFGQHGIVRVDTPGRSFEAGFTWSGSPEVEPSQRIQVLIGTNPYRVTLTLGRPPQPRVN